MRLLAWLSMSIFGLLLTTSPSVADDRLSAINQSGDTLLTAVWKKREATVTIRAAKLEADRHGEIPSNRSNDKAIGVIRELSISVDGHQVFVPRSVFADLIDPRKAKIGFEPGRFVLSIGGGDGADSYVLHVYFDGKKITRRALYSSLVPDKAVEVTRYWLRVLKDE